MIPPWQIAIIQDPELHEDFEEPCLSTSDNENAKFHSDLKSSASNSRGANLELRESSHDNAKLLGQISHHVKPSSMPGDVQNESVDNEKGSGSKNEENLKFMSSMEELCGGLTESQKQHAAKQRELLVHNLNEQVISRSEKFSSILETIGWQWQKISLFYILHEYIYIISYSSGFAPTRIFDNQSKNN